MALRRALLPLLLVLAAPALAGCLEPGAADPPAGTTPAAAPPTTTAAVHPGAPPCGRLTATVTPAEGFRPGERAEVALALENCGERTLHADVPFCPDAQRLVVTLVIEERAWHLGGMAARPEPVHGGCETTARAVPPGGREALQTVFWSGALAAEGCADARPYCAWAPAGTFPGEAVLRSAEGDAWNASFSITLLPPVLPPYAQDGDLLLVLDESYEEGETAQVRLRNVGERTYVYNQFYAACHLRYHDGEGYPFLIPPGTHCDLVNEQPVAPGEEVVLFSWGLDECVEDRWGCAESRPLAPGTYHVSGWFREEGAPYEDESRRSRAGATFRIT